MLQYNELRITQDKKYLIVDVQVQELSYYENVYLDTIIIDTQKTYSALGPSNNPFMTIQMEPNTKHYRKFIDIDSVADNMFFVYTTVNGSPSEDVPCGMSQETILGVAYDKYPIYKQGMSLLSQLHGCDIPSDLKDFILQNKAFEITLQAGNYPKAIEYWGLFFKEKEKAVKSGCGCHGIFR